MPRRPRSSSVPSAQSPQQGAQGTRPGAALRRARRRGGRRTGPAGPHCWRSPRRPAPGRGRRAGARSATGTALSATRTGPGARARGARRQFRHGRAGSCRIGGRNDAPSLRARPPRPAPAARARTAGSRRAAPPPARRRGRRPRRRGAGLRIGRAARRCRARRRRGPPRSERERPRGASRPLLLGAGDQADSLSSSAFDRRVDSPSRSAATASSVEPSKNVARGGSGPTAWRCRARRQAHRRNAGRPVHAGRAPSSRGSEERPHRGVAGRIGQVGLDLGGRGALAREQDVEDLALTSADVEVGGAVGKSRHISFSPHAYFLAVCWKLSIEPLGACQAAFVFVGCNCVLGACSGSVLPKQSSETGISGAPAGGRRT